MSWELLRLVLNSVLRAAKNVRLLPGEYSPFRRKRISPAKTYTSNDGIYYDSKGKAWTLEQKHLNGRLTRGKWTRAREFDSKH